MGLCVLIDTNVLIDFISKREPYFEDARIIVDTCDRHFYRGCIAAHSVPNIFYILRKSIPETARREVLRKFCYIFEVVGIDRKRLIDALDDQSFPDFEDCLQFRCAEVCHADYIVTRNPKDFTQSTIPTISPDTFRRRYLDTLLAGQEDE